MATAYVLIGTEMGAESEVIELLKNVPEVKEAHSVYGDFDIIARLEADIMEEIKFAISKKIRSIKKIRSTTTLIAPF